MSARKSAERLARVMASDIAVYNEEAIKRGIQNDTLFEELSDDLQDAERNWRERVDGEFQDDLGLFKRALIDNIFRGVGNIPSDIF